MAKNLTKVFFMACALQKWPNFSKLDMKWPIQWACSE